MMEVLGILPARSGSTRVSEKNVRLMAGRPLLAWTALAARESRFVTRLVCSTDSDGIAATAREYGCETPFLRPDALAGPDVTTHPVEKHALWWLDEHEGYRPDIVVRLQPTSPLREASDIDACVQAAIEWGSCVSVEKVCDHRFQVAVMTDGELIPLYGKKLRSRRSQDVGDLYTWNGAVYAARLETWEAQNGYFGTDTRGYVMDRERGIDIDTWEDWEEAEKRLKEEVVA